MTSKILKFDEFTQYMKPRERDAHKGLFGHVLIIGGDYGYSGAPRLAAEAALRTGAGLVSVATRKEHAFCMNIARPEMMCHAVNSAKDLKPLLLKATVIVIGPGMGQSNWAKALLKTVLKVEKPLIVDADALNILSKQPVKNDHWILTPHPGEAARLLGVTTEEIQRNRLLSGSKIQKKYGGICVLKGAGSLVVACNEEPVESYLGNPGMATAGMGDVLSGVLAGLLAQNIPLADAAKLGVLTHAMAGDLAARAGERGMIASDLFPFLRQLVNGYFE